MRGTRGGIHVGGKLTIGSAPSLLDTSNVAQAVDQRRPFRCRQLAACSVRFGCLFGTRWIEQLYGCRCPVQLPCCRADRCTVNARPALAQSIGVFLKGWPGTGPSGLQRLRQTAGGFDQLGRRRCLLQERFVCPASVGNRVEQLIDAPVTKSLECRTYTAVEQLAGRVDCRLASHEHFPGGIAVRILPLDGNRTLLLSDRHRASLPD